MNTLYPPTQMELMKPSPIRYLQVLGALDYVLRIHKVDNLLRLEAFSQDILLYQLYHFQSIN